MFNLTQMATFEGHEAKTQRLVETKKFCLDLVVDTIRRWDTEERK
jgi:hypothetical protein